MIQPMLYGGFFKDSIVVLAAHPAMGEMAREFRGAWGMAMHSISTLPFWLMVAGVLVAYVLYILKPEVPAAIRSRFDFVYRVLDNKYYFDWFNEKVLAVLARGMGQGLWKGGDQALIDGLINGSARAVGGLGAAVRLLQTGFIYWYALVMVLGVFALLSWQLWPYLSGLVGR
jgi:NADH-quinone oxidoreductase subunit L